MQLMERGITADAVFACVGGGSNAIGIFTTFLENNRRASKRDRVELVGIEAAGHGIETGLHSASIASGEPGVLHGNYSYLLQDEGGQVMPAHSISAGLDYPGVGPEHAWLKESEQVRYEAVPDDKALAAFQDLCCLEGIIPALESAHALAGLRREAELWCDKTVVICLSGRGDKDVDEVVRLLDS
jgi:tryptophan synthase beta chain